jgi:hypothetical protein
MEERWCVEQAVETTWHSSASQPHAAAPHAAQPSLGARFICTGVDVSYEEVVRVAVT